MTTTARPARDRFLFGLFQYRHVSVPSLRGWLLLACLGFVSLVLIIWRLHPFLAANNPRNTGTLICDGASDDKDLAEAIRLCREGTYDRLLVTGGEFKKGRLFFQYASIADLGAARIEKMSGGVLHPEAVADLPAHGDPVFVTATSVRQWMEAHGGIPRDITLLCGGPSGRRVSYGYSEVFAGKARIGVISTTPTDYTPARWWTSSQGVRCVLGDVIAYAYVLAGCGRAELSVQQAR